MNLAAKMRYVKLNFIFPKMIPQQDSLRTPYDMNSLLYLYKLIIMFICFGCVMKLC